MTEALPKTIGRFEIRKELGRGTMGIVYHAHDPLLGRNVALKAIHLPLALPENERKAFEQRFFLEARAAAGLSHPGVVIVYDVGQDAATGMPYLALEYLRGKTLAELLSTGKPMEWREALRVTACVAKALSAAHASGIIHRDVKPANIMLLGSGEAKIMDFGVAKIAAEHLTAAGMVFGSPSYMSPEQAAGRPLDSRSDLFSLGAVSYELLTAKRAFTGPNVPAIVRQVARENPPPPSSVVPGLPADVDNIIAKALAKDPARRYATGDRLAEDLDDLLAGRTPRHCGASPRLPSDVTPRPGSIPSPVRPSGPPQPSSSHFDPDATGVAGWTRQSLALPAGKRVSLAILSGPRAGEVLVLDRPRVVFGRAGRGGADVELADPEVSRTHAALECHGQRIVLQDLGSTNGTFVNEQRIESHALDDHTEFRLGRTRFVLILADLD